MSAKQSVWALGIWNNGVVTFNILNVMDTVTYHNNFDSKTGLNYRLSGVIAK